jgi:LysM repeat protein
MHRNTIITVCAIFCVVAVGAGLLVARLSGQSAIAVQPAEVGTTSAPPTVAAAQPTIAAPTISAPAATSQPEPTSAPAATAAPASATAVPAATSQPQPTATAVPVAEAPAYIEYTVQKGDILYTIAKEHNVTVEDILAINQISRPESLTVGQVIRIPRQ